MNREAIYSALFARAQAATWAALGPDQVTTWRSSSRKLQHWSNVQPENMPALFQTQRIEEVEQVTGRPPRWVLRAELFVYVATMAAQDAEVVPSQQLNPILDAIQAALSPKPADGSPSICTLGKLVNECKIQGTVEDYEGDLGDLGVLIIPVEIVVPF